ncbi:hypothetical protein F5Y06DRAFT_304293 [Hypoxylon sp. FL0890]|nr:hypothetical protein F5Y06DRAFT_304293 [Hypoxylon sp. FL0890]
MSNLGPLTTTFTPASECSSAVLGIAFMQTLDDGNIATHTYQSLGLGATSECYPPGYGGPSDYYSPGVCPAGWGLACGTVYSIASLTETTAKCCPLGYTCQSGATETWSTLSCLSTALSDISVTVPDLSDQFFKVTVLSNIPINAAAVTVRWQRSDLPASETIALATASASSALDTLSGSASTSSILDASPLPSISLSKAGDDSPPSNAATALSENDKIGIGVGVGALAVICSVIVLLWLRRRKKTTKGNQIDPVIQDARPEVMEMPQEMWAQYQQELQTPSNTPEMATEHNRHEVYGVSSPAESSSER